MFDDTTALLNSHNYNLAKHAQSLAAWEGRYIDTFVSLKPD